MYDLHCHLLPAIDDGPQDLEAALDMARSAVADGITTIACTPHIYPGVYENTADAIRSAIARFRANSRKTTSRSRSLKGRMSTSRLICAMAFGPGEFPPLP